MTESKRKTKHLLRGSQKPTKCVQPAYSRTEGKDAGFLAESYGMKPDKWQQDILNAWLAFDEYGLFASSICGLSVPRQNGKNGLLEMRELYGLLVRGETIIHSSHEVRSQNVAFNRLASYFSQPEVYPEIAETVKTIRKANGQERIELKPEFGGGIISFSARSRQAMRGQTVDLIIFDEAQELTYEQMAAMLPASSASPTGNSQKILTGTPPDERTNGEVFQDVRKSALSNKADDTICWFEWSVSEVGDISDEKRWIATNPALGTRITPKTIHDELLFFARSPESFARERLGMWSEGVQNTCINPKTWESLALDIADIPKESDTEKLAFGVKFSADGSRVAIAVAEREKNKQKAYVECVAHQSMSCGIGWVADRIEKVQNSACCVVIDGKSGQQNLIEELIRRRVKKKFICSPATSDVVSACAGFLSDIYEKKVYHSNQPALNESVYNAMRRPIGNAGGFGFKGYADADVSPLEACSLALWGLKTSKRDPKRKAVIL